MDLSGRYDYLIVGAGSAGCVMANRLSADAQSRVLLLEAGGPDRSPFIHMPASASIAARKGSLTWGYYSEPEPALADRRISEIRGKVLGGSSSVNGMVANRGNPRDYDAWARQDLPSWSFAHCLPYFRKMETFDRGANDYRGGDGPQHIETCPADNPLDQAFLEAGVQAGYALTDDQNGRQHAGFHVAQKFTHRGRRWSTAVGYLKPALHRPNLTVITGALAHQVLFDGDRAVGLTYVHRGQTRRIEVEREVILCGGAINSPHLLLLSGVGDAQQLSEHGVSLVAHVPAVGQHLEDHLIVPVQYSARKPVSVAHRLGPLGRIRLALQWGLFRTGLGTSNFCETGCFFKSAEDVDYADLQHEFYPMRSEIGHDEKNVAAGFMFSMGIMRPSSQGSIRLKSADPETHPLIRFNYLESEVDKRVLINGLWRTRDMVAQSAWDELRGEELSPGKDARSDKDILGWIEAMGSTEYHPCSTCRIGVDERSVTDAEGRVHGVVGLRVVDASIMPSNITANLNAPVIMMAEKIADQVRGLDALPALHLPVE